MFDFFDFVKEWIFTGIYDFFVSATAWLITSMITSALDYVLWTLNFIWSVGEAVIDALDVTALIASGFSLLPSSMHGYALALKLPQVVNVLMVGLVAKFTLRFVPFL